ncbi:NAD-dependent epimerase/dehydratase family protein [Paenibacillus sp. IITD108]|uniref:NAD-dependent epimerase/dehydratase family protein n=1 Tax=Paenibacillus sp. IITD108 TaxID=3116649 RepID=UPI002F3FA860
MKVLITGGYGFIGSHVADRFHKEGHDIYIIDNLSTGKKENITFKHKGYILSVEDSKCAEIFRSNKFDIVVHLAAQVSVAHSVAQPTVDAESNVLGLVNMLNLSAEHHVKKFIYASSAAVYGLQEQLPITEDAHCSPISPYGISKLSGELYSSKWEELYGLSTLGLRFSNVYGPRQDGLGEGGVISIFMNRMIAEQPLLVYGDGEQTRDFIYVEDVAYAIYRGANSYQSGIYNLSVNQQTSVNRIISVLGEIQPLKEVVYTEKRVGDIDHSVLDNTRVMRDFDWSPLYTIEEGLKRTAHSFIQQSAEQQTAASAGAVLKSPMQIKLQEGFKRLLPSIENIVAFLLTAWLTLTYANSSYGAIDVKLFYITIIGILYGNRQAILAVVLSSGLYVYQKLLDGRDIISLTYDTDFFFQIAIYLFIGLVVGYSIERKNTIIQQQEQKVNEVNERYEFLENVYTEVREVKDELQLRILNSGDSYGKIYAATKELESLEPEQVFNAAVTVVKSIMHVPKVTIYTVNPQQSYLRLLASSGYSLDTLPKSLKVSDHHYLTMILQTGEIYINRQLEDSIPLMVAPIMHKDRIAAVIAIDGLTFESFSLYHQNLFRITVDLISSALSKAFTYIDATESQRYMEGSTLLQADIFQEILNSKIQAFDQHQVPFLLLKAELSNITLIEAAMHVSSKLRETDYVGLNKNNEMLVLLSNTSIEDSNPILQRLAHASIELRAVREE